MFLLFFFFLSHNNSYADSTISGYRYGDVFVEETTKSEGIACSNYANCYIGCSCNTSNGWYSSCQGTDCKSVTDTRYTGQVTDGTLHAKEPTVNPLQILVILE